MVKIALVSDSTADMPSELANSNDINFVEAYVHFGTETFVASDMTMEEFHNRAENASKADFPKTSQPKAHDLLEVYEKLKESGFECIFSIHVASELSGTINSANVARGMIDGVDIRIIDCRGTTANLMATLLEAREFVNAGQSPDEIESKLEEFCTSLYSYISLRTLDNLVRGGRISKVRYRLGGLLNIKPVLRLGGGAISAFDKARGVEKAREKAYALATERFEQDHPFKYVISHTREEELAKKFEQRLLSEFPNASGHCVEIGLAISVHAGRGAILVLTYE